MYHWHECYRDVNVYKDAAPTYRLKLQQHAIWQSPLVFILFALVPSMLHQPIIRKLVLVCLCLYRCLADILHLVIHVIQLLLCERICILRRMNHGLIQNLICNPVTYACRE